MHAKIAFSRYGRWTVLAPVALVILGFAVYSNSLHGKFIWDDDDLVKDNAYIRSWSNVPKVLTSNLTAGAGKTDDFYRPLQIFTYMTDYSLWKLKVEGYHFTNTLLHILAGLSIYWLITILYHDRFLSILTSIFFVVHPIHTEAVAYISGRSDSLALVFMLLTFIFYVKWLDSKRTSFCILMILTYILAFLSRENSLVLALLLLLWHYSFRKRIKLKEFLPILGVAFIYIFLRLTVLRGFLSHVHSSTTVFERLPGVFVALANYTRLIALPFHLHMEYGNILFNPGDPRVIAGILILSSLIIYTLRKRKSNGLVFFSISWFFIVLLPTSNLYPINAYMAEHWLYVPSVGFFLILAKGLSSLCRKKEYRNVTIVFIICLLGFYSCLTIRQNGYWSEPTIFYTRTLRYAPDSSRLHNNLGKAYSRVGKTEEAIASCKKAIGINPDYADAYNNLGNAYSDSDRKEEAIVSYERAIKINPKHAEAYYNLGNVYSEIGKKKEAISFYKKAIGINPNDADMYNNLGNRYYDIGEKEEAEALYRKAIEINPNYGEAYNNLAVVSYYKNQYSLAIQYCDRAIELGSRVNPKFLKLLEPYRK